MAIKLNPPNKFKNAFSLEKGDESKKAFIEESSQHKPIDKILQENKESTSYPWNNSRVREDVIKTFNIRLTEPDWLKLKYVSDKMKESMQEIILDALIPSMNRKLKKILEEDKI